MDEDTSTDSGQASRDRFATAVFVAFIIVVMVGLILGMTGCSPSRGTGSTVRFGEAVAELNGDRQYRTLKARIVRANGDRLEIELEGAEIDQSPIVRANLEAQRENTKLLQQTVELARDAVNRTP